MTYNAAENKMTAQFGVTFDLCCIATTVSVHNQRSHLFSQVKYLQYCHTVIFTIALCQMYNKEAIINSSFAMGVGIQNNTP